MKFIRKFHSYTYVAIQILCQLGRCTTQFDEKEQIWALIYPNYQQLDYHDVIMAFSTVSLLQTIRKGKQNLGKLLEIICNLRCIRAFYQNSFSFYRPEKILMMISQRNMDQYIYFFLSNLDMVCMFHPNGHIFFNFSSLL